MKTAIARACFAAGVFWLLLVFALALTGSAWHMVTIFPFTFGLGSSHFLLPAAVFLAAEWLMRRGSPHEWAG